MKKFCFLLLLSLCCFPLCAKQWRPIRDSKITVLPDGAAVQITAPGRGMTKSVSVRKKILADISFEARGNVDIGCNIFAKQGITDTPAFKLNDKWQRFSFRYYFLQTWQNVQFKGKKKGEFSIRNLKVTPVKLPAFAPQDIPGLELDLTRGKHGKLTSLDGKKARQGGAYSRMLLYAPPQTSKMLYLFLEVKLTGKGRQAIVVKRDRQPLASVTCQASDSWQWVKTGPLPAEVMYPECEITLGGNRSVIVSIARAVLTTDPDWKPHKNTTRQTTAPQLVIGKGNTGVLAGPFSKINENRFAADQSTVKLTYDEKNLKAEFICQEKVLDPTANRLHEFKTKEKDFQKNDYVILLLLRRGKMYDFIVSGTGKLENAVSTAPDFWRSRKTAWKSGTKSRAAIGNGRWTAALEIPWESIGGFPEKNEVIKFQVGRKSNPGKELSVLFPTKTGFHDARNFGLLTLTENAPDVTIKMPDFRPGANKLQINGAPFIGKLVFRGFPLTYFCEENFNLTRTGNFTFSWQIQIPATGETLFNSPVYQLSTTASLLEFDNKNSIVLNGRTVKSGALLNDGLNQLEIPQPFHGKIKVNGQIITPPAKKFTLAVNSSLLWPNWQAKELAVNRGGIQMLLFSPNGFPGTTLRDYRLKLNLPRGFKLECASGYYKNYKLAWTPEGEIRFLTEIPYRKTLPSHQFIAAFIRVPANFKGSVTELSFSSGSKAHNIVEVPQKVSIRVLPPLKAGKLKKLTITMSTSWLAQLTEKAYIDKVVAYLASAGVNAMTNVPNKRIKYGYMFNLKSWNWTIAPYLAQHPEAALTRKNGQKDPLHICPEYMRKAEFAAWLKTQIPGWLKKASNAPIIEWDYEYGYATGPFSCYCQLCSKKTDVVSRNQNMADYAKLLRDALKAFDSRIIFTVYSAYQSEKNKHVYGVDWRMLKDIVDFATCGYGRPAEELQETQKILGKTPLALGAIVTPYDKSSRAYPRQYTTAWLLRRAVDSTGGILLYALDSLDGYSMAATAEVSQIMEKYEDFIRFGTRQTLTLPGWPSTDVQVIEHKGEKVLFLMNSSESVRKYKTRAVSPGKVWIQKLEK